MPNHTSSYSGNTAGGKRRRPAKNSQDLGRYTKRDLGRVYSPKTKRRRKPGASYLQHTQGFGKNNRMHVRRPRRRDSRFVYALIGVGCALAIFVASIIGYVNRSVDIKLNGSAVSVHVDSSISAIIENQGLSGTLKHGDLLAVDDSVLKKEGGESYYVKLNGKRIKPKRFSKITVSGGEKLTIQSGRDVYEPHTVEVSSTEPTLSEAPTGAIQYVKTWGVASRSEVWVGKSSGKTADRGEVRAVTDCALAGGSASPSGKKKLVAITFDAGPSKATDQILAVLKKKNVKATFFLTGQQVEQNVAAARAIAKAGHELGSSGYTHTTLSKLEKSELRDEIKKGLTAIKVATGTSTALFRAPSGLFTAQNWADSMDLIGCNISWNIDSGDRLLKGADYAAQNVTATVSNGNVVLFTDSDATASQTPEALEQTIDTLSSEGYEFATVSELVKSDSSLSERLSDPTKVSMPKDATLPEVKTEDDAS